MRMNLILLSLSALTFFSPFIAFSQIGATDECKAWSVPEVSPSTQFNVELTGYLKDRFPIDRGFRFQILLIHGDNELPKYHLQKNTTYGSSVLKELKFSILKKIVAEENPPIPIKPSISVSVAEINKLICDKKLLPNRMGQFRLEFQLDWDPGLLQHYWPVLNDDYRNFIILNRGAESLGLSFTDSDKRYQFKGHVTIKN